MSINYYPQNPPKLRSPLLENILENKKDNKKGKKTFFNPILETAGNIDDTLDKTLFKKNVRSERHKQIIISSTAGEINEKSIGYLENIFKIAFAFITAVGGSFCILELINIVRTIQSGSFVIGGSMLYVTLALIITTVANIICIGFIHIIKTTKHVYNSLESQNIKLNSLITTISR